MTNRAEVIKAVAETTRELGVSRMNSSVNDICMNPFARVSVGVKLIKGQVLLVYAIQAPIRWIHLCRLLFAIPEPSRVVKLILFNVFSAGQASPSPSVLAQPKPKQKQPII